ncbi:MAG: hypothetical protein IJP03_03915, partial [Christensenellaceae bacterium]|nr:hypothetical protein [Christensenellaceae bacterium]
MKKIILRQIPLGLDEPKEALRKKAARLLRVTEGDIAALDILRESLDARKKEELHFSCHVAVSLLDAAAKKAAAGGAELWAEKKTPDILPGDKPLAGRPVVVGLGPCGLFAALRLAQAGLKPLVLERGRPLEERQGDIARLQGEALLDPESNICFGEGGAGAFSDGKLTTRIKDPRSAQVLKEMIASGAPEEIAYQAKPHLGTENVRKVVADIRRRIEKLGGTVLFGAKWLGWQSKNGCVSAALYEYQGKKLSEETNALVLAIGHSARDTFARLLEGGLALESKPFAVGVRVEHPRQLIDENQHGKFAGHPRLGAADYKLTAQAGGRGVYSFCMCPGGEVVCSATEEGAAAVNGMSYYARDGRLSNSAIVVSVNREDMPAGPLGGVELQRRLEQAAYRAAGGYGAVAQNIGDFMTGK